MTYIRDVRGPYYIVYITVTNFYQIFVFHISCNTKIIVIWNILICMFIP